ncbi:SDR family oxidoreductase [Aliiroseovarius sp. S253]|uniref:SDR family oxidoreductase n=1 Tax=Aliiroseovarius sp. S253 TaxID=3415133 RepID=UPI003C79D23E
MCTTERDRDHCAIVPGGSEGIVLATSRALVANGVYVFMLGRDAAKLQAAVEETDPTVAEQLVPFTGDVTDASIRQELVAATVERFGGPDILLNNAGGGSENRFLEDIDQVDFQQVMALNLDSSFDLCRLVVPYMKARKGGIPQTISGAPASEVMIAALYPKTETAPSVGAVCFTYEAI